MTKLKNTTTTNFPTVKVKKKKATSVKRKMTEAFSLMVVFITVISALAIVFITHANSAVIEIEKTLDLKYTLPITSIKLFLTSIKTVIFCKLKA